MDKIGKFDNGKPLQKEDSRMSKINTTLLSICTAGILWMAREMNSIDSRVSSLEALTNERAVNLNVRLSQIENRQSTEGPKIFEIGARVDVLESRFKK